MPQFNKVVTELGRVIKNRGEWTSLASDAKLYTDNVVQYNHSAYIVKSTPQGDAGIVKSTITSPADSNLFEVFAGVGTLDETPTAGSENLVKSGGVMKEIGDYVPTAKSLFSPSTNASGWELTGTGLCSQNPNAKLVKYQVTAGKYLKLSLSKDNPGVFQFQNNASVPSTGTNTYLIGSPVIIAVNSVVKVPTGATYLIVSQNSNNNTNAVYSCYNDIDETPVLNSKNVVESGGVKSYVDNCDNQIYSEISSLKFDLGKESSVILSGITTEGYYIETNAPAKVYANPQWSYACPIYLKKGQTIEVETQGYGVDIIAQCNSSGDTSSFVSLVRPQTSSGLTKYTYTAESNIYVAVSFKAALGDTSVKIQGASEYATTEEMKQATNEILSLSNEITSLNVDVFELQEETFVKENINSELVFTTGQRYGSIGSQISFYESNQWRNTYLTDVTGKSVSIQVPYLSSPSSLIQYVDSSEVVTRIFETGHTSEQIVDFVLPPFKNDEVKAYISSSPNHFYVFEIDKEKSKFETYTENIRLSNNTLVQSHICAHRGLAGSTREINYNDLVNCYTAGFKRIETDLVNSSDGVIFCSHSGKVNGVDITTLTAQQVREAIIGDNHVLSLEEVLLFCKTHDIILEMDMASTTRLIDDFVPNVVDLVRKTNTFATVIFTAFKTRIQSIYNLASNVMVCISSGATREDDQPKTDEQVFAALNACVSNMKPVYQEVSMAYGTAGINITKERVEYAHNLGFAVKVYLSTDIPAGEAYDTEQTMNSLFEMGVDCMLTDSLIPNEVSSGLIYELARLIVNNNE